MNAHIAVERAVERFMRGVAVGVLAFGSVATAQCEPRASTQSVTITVFTNHYTVEALAFDDLDYLEQHVTAMHVRDVQLLVCGAKATRALKAVVHRFRHLPVQIRIPDIDELDCMSKASPATLVRQRNGQRPFGIDDAAVERYWLDIMP